MTIYTIVGACPQFVKSAVVSRALRNIRCVRDGLIHAVSIFDHNMSQIFFDEIGIPQTDLNLGIGGGSQGRETLTIWSGSRVLWTPFHLSPRKCPSYLKFHPRILSRLTLLPTANQCQSAVPVQQPIAHYQLLRPLSSLVMSNYDSFPFIP